jgi:hypothetical protein
MKAPKQKSGRALLRFGRECLRAKQNLSPADYAAWKRQQPQLRHEAHPDRVVTDLDRRYIKLALLPVLWKFQRQLPNTGISTLRELAKLGEEKLRYLFTVGLIGPGTTRAEVDTLRTAQYQPGKAVASRHKSKLKSDEARS